MQTVALVIRALLLGFFSLSAITASAQQFATKPIRIIIPFSPGGTPKSIVERINAEIGRIIVTADFRDKAAAQGLEVFVSTPDQYGAMLKAESEKFARVIGEAGIEPQ